MTRWKAAGIHLALSALVGTAVIAWMLLVWYPEPFFAALGGNDLVVILVAVDVALGPLITSIVFNPRKERRLMRFDLAVIAVLQLMALSYGVGVLAIGRPAYMVFTIDRFDLVTANELREAELARVKDPRFQGVPWGRPQTIGVRSPSDPNEQMRIIESAARGADLQTFPQHYVPYVELAQNALRHSKPLERLRKGHPEEAAQIDAELQRVGHALPDTRYLPLKARKRDFTVLLDAKSGAVIGFLDIVPW